MILINIWIVVGMITAVVALLVTQRHTVVSSLVTFLVTVEGAFMGGLFGLIASRDGVSGLTSIGVALTTAVLAAWTCRYVVKILRSPA